MLGFNRKTSARRRLAFVIFGVFTFTFYFLAKAISWPKDINFQNLWTVASVSLASTAGVIAFIKLITRKKNKYLFIAGGFLGVSILEGYSLFTSLAVSSFLWTLSRLFLSAFFLLSLKGWREGEGKQKGLKPTVYISAGALTLVAIILATFLPRFNPYNQILVFGRPMELLAALLFGLGTYGYIKKGYWEFKYFEFWLVLSLMSAFFAQIFMTLSHGYFDASYFGAIVLKNLGYLFALIGLLASTWAAFREVEAEKKYLAGHTKGEAYLKGK